MKKILIALSLVVVLLFGGCTPKPVHILKGSYQSEREGIGYIILISFQQDNSFVEYIDNREVDRGTYEKIKNNVHKIKSNKQNFEVTLSAENSFEIIIKKLKDGKPIQLKNISNIPVGFSYKFNDVDKYKSLLN